MDGWMDGWMDGLDGGGVCDVFSCCPIWLLSVAPLRPPFHLKTLR